MNTMNTRLAVMLKECAERLNEYFDAFPSAQDGRDEPMLAEARALLSEIETK